MEWTRPVDLQKEIFPELKLGLLHGRMKPDEKDQVMADFPDKKYDLLVSTTVVEVGVDVPNATVMLVEGANRFGLAQLHQLRGRVGRGAAQSYCLLVPDHEDAVENERLQAMAETNDGFILADRDLQQRGPGEFLGTRQAGFDFRLRGHAVEGAQDSRLRQVCAHLAAARPARLRQPTPTGPVAVQLVTPPPAMLEPGELAGPGYQLAAASMQTSRDRHRLLSPVWQWQQSSPVALSDDMRTALGPRWVWDLGDGWQSPISMLARRRVPRHTGWLRVLVQWATWRTNPLNQTDPVDLRLHTADGPPNAFTKSSSKTITRTANDGVMGLGELSLMDFVWVERDGDGFTWVWVSARTDFGSGSGNATYTVRSIPATPVVLGEGYDGQAPNQWGP